MRLKICAITRSAFDGWPKWLRIIATGSSFWIWRVNSTRERTPLRPLATSGDNADRRNYAFGNCVSALLNETSVTDKKDKAEVARLERLNDELKRSLRRCRDMLHDYEVRLTANSNEPDTAGTQEQGKA